MKNNYVEMSITNREYMSQELKKMISDSFGVFLLSCSASRRYFLVTDDEYYYVIRLVAYSIQTFKADCRYIASRKISDSEREYNFYDYIWHEECGVVTLCYKDEKGKDTIDFVYDENLFERSAMPFYSKSRIADKETLDASEEIVFECSIFDHTLDRLLPEELRKILSESLRRTYKDGVFRFYEYSFLEKNAVEYLESDKSEKTVYDSFLNPRNLYDVICEAHGVENNDFVSFSLVFSFENDCALTMKTEII